MLKLTELIDQLIHVNKIPTLSNIAIMIENSLNEEEPDVKKISAIILDDPPLTGMVLKVANSAAYGARRQIGTVQDAIMRLGLQEIRKMVLKLAMAKYLSDMLNGLIDIKDFWTHSIAVAYSTKFINDRLHISPSDAHSAYVVGLLHDIGRLVTAAYMPEFHQHIRPEDAKTAGVNQIIKLERKHLGLDHSQIGAALLERWGLPLSLVSCIRYHHEPQVSPQMQRQTTMLVHVADRFCRVHNIGDVGEGLDDKTARENLLKLGLHEAEQDKILEEIDQKLKKSQVVLNLSTN